MTLAALLVVAGCLTALGCFALLGRRPRSGLWIGAQLLALGVVVALLAFDRFQPAGRASRGEVFALLVAVAGVTQAAVGLALSGLLTESVERERERPAR